MTDPNAADKTKLSAAIAATSAGESANIQAPDAPTIPAGAEESIETVRSAKPSGVSTGASAPAADEASASEAVATPGDASAPGKPSAAKASVARAAKAQEDRLAAALRANLARRKAASRAARQAGQQTDADDPDA